MRRSSIPIPLSLALLLLVALAGCARYDYRPFSPRVAPALGQMRDDHAVIDAFYVTDRRLTEAPEPWLRFGAERGPRVHLGTCEVSIPAAHYRGYVGDPPLLARRDPGRFVLLTELSDPADSQWQFWRELARAADRSPRREVFIFIHGFYVTFDEAARRTSQIAHDIEFAGPAIVYSWPSQGWLLGYLADSTNIEWAEPHLAEFLRELADHPEIERIHILAHSMGAKLLCRAVREMVRERTGRRTPELGEVILAAADIDAEIFERDYAPALAKAARRVTIYASRSDWALGGAEKLYGYARLGTSVPTSGPAAAGPIEIIDATDVDKDLLGHFYYGSAPEVLDDVACVIRGEAPQARRVRENGRSFKLLAAAARSSAK